VRINQYLAKYTDLSRRGADSAIAEGRVEINGTQAKIGDTVIQSDKVTLDGHQVESDVDTISLIMNKPVGYVCSRNGQGSATVYDLLPSKYSHLNTVGRLDKNSSGLLLLTNDGELANLLTHPRYEKTKIYEVSLNKGLQPLHQQMISDHGIQLEDGPSKLKLEKMDSTGKAWRVIMREGRNRQIRRTFESLGYKVTKLHRTHFGKYELPSLKSGEFSVIV
jgi:23S rRNA pseudouridine2605 synthase